MLDILRDYLTQSATPELVTALVSAHDTFERIGLENYEQGFEELLLTSDDVDASDTVTAIHDLTRNLQLQILTEHDIRPDEETPLAVLDIIINGVLDIPHYDNVIELQQTASMDGPVNEVFAEVLALVTPMSTDELLPYLDEVGAFMLVRIKELAKREEETNEYVDEELEERHARHASKLALYLNMLAAIDANYRLKTVELIQSGVGVGFTYSIYLTALMAFIEELPVDRLAEELVAIALVSKDGLDNPRSAIKANIDKVVSDIDRSTRVDVAVGALLLRLNNYEQV